MASATTFNCWRAAGTIHVHRNQHRPVPALFQPRRQLARGGGLAGTLQPGHQDHCGRLGRKFELGRVLAQDFDQFVMHDLDDLLRRRERRHHFLADGLCLDAVDKLLDHLEVDVGFQQRHADFFAAPPGCFPR